MHMRVGLDIIRRTGLLLLCLFVPAVKASACLTTFADPDSDGVYAYGFASASDPCAFFSTSVTGTVNSPTGRTATASGSGQTYAFATAQLLLLADYGNWSVDASGCSDASPCQFDFKFFKIGAQRVSWVWDTTQPPANDCFYVRNCIPAPPGSYCGPDTVFILPSPVFPKCINFTSRKYTFFKFFNTLRCNEIQPPVSIESQNNIPCDNPIPGFP